MKPLTQVTINTPSSNKTSNTNLKVGNFYRNKKIGNIYVLSFVVGKYVLIGIVGGGYYAMPNIDITKVFGDSGADAFELVTCEITPTVVDVTPTIEVGQYYKDVSMFGMNKLYVVSEVYHDGDNCYQLVNVSNGTSYSNLTRNIGRVFGGDREDFVLVKNVTITAE
jgi:hypothetical protein